MASLRQTVAGTKHGFTLLELLVVMVIIAMMMAMIMPAFDRLTVVSGVDGGAAMISGQVRATRQHAIARRTRAALMVYRHGYLQAIRTAQLNRSNGFVQWTPNSAWQFLPTGAVVDMATNTITIAVPATQMSPLLLQSPLPSGDLALEGIVFIPSGKLSGSNSPVLRTSDSLASVVGATTTYSARGGGNNWQEVRVNPFTGRAVIAGP